MVRSYSGDKFFSSHLESKSKKLRGKKGYLSLRLSFCFNMVCSKAFSSVYQALQKLKKLNSTHPGTFWPNWICGSSPICISSAQYFLIFEAPAQLKKSYSAFG